VAVKGAGTERQQALTLHMALVHPDISKVSKTASFHSKMTKAVAYQWKQIVDMLQVATGKEEAKNCNKEDISFLNTLLTALAPGPMEVDSGAGKSGRMCPVVEV
jgi:hypothetical protein